MVQVVLLISVAFFVNWQRALHPGAASMTMNDRPPRGRGSRRHPSLVCVVHRASVTPAQTPYRLRSR